MQKKTLFLMVLLSFSVISWASPRKKIDLSASWHFVLGNHPQASQTDYDDSKWQLIDVPHDWSIEGQYNPSNPQGGNGGYLPTGIGWYRKTFSLPPDWENKQVNIHFDAVYMNSEVWINGHYLGKRPYGYISFAYDLTPFLEKKNVISVRVDNSTEPSARWYHGAGIYGYVSLEATNELRVSRWGTFVRTLDVSEDKALIKVTTELDIPNADENVTISQQIISLNGKTLQNEIQHTGALISDNYLNQEIIVPHPQLWSPSIPNVYTLETRVYKDNAMTDIYHTRFGIRTIRYDADLGFFINEQPMKIKGVCEHYHGGPVGMAYTRPLMEWRLNILRDMGCNAIRTSHYPFTPMFYELCDSMGILVLDEIFDGWHKKAPYDYGARYFNEWWKKDTEDWIRRDRNHPSVIMYSVGNETGKDDIHDITGFIHSLDPTKPITGGTMWGGVDIPGFNGPAEIFSYLEKFRNENPDKPVVLTEVPHTYSTRGFYRVCTWWRDRGKPNMTFAPYGTTEIFKGGKRQYSSSYDNAGVRVNVRMSLARTLKTPWIIGDFRWTGFDYLGECGWTAGGWPARIFNHGIIDLAGFPKDTYFLYQSEWSDKPMVHLLPHWTHPGMEGISIPVVAYSNCDEVELFLNGKSKKRLMKGESGEFLWNVDYEPGILLAVGYNHGQKMAQASFNTASFARKLLLETKTDQLSSARESLAMVTVSVKDEMGVMNPNSHDRVHYRIKGPVRLLSMENGDPVDISGAFTTQKNLFYGLSRVFLSSTGKVGDISLSASAIMGDSVFRDSVRVAIDAVEIMLRGHSSDNATRYVIHYTCDGTPCTKDSPIYRAPFLLEQDAVVRAVVYDNGKEHLRMEKEFRKGETPAWNDDRFMTATSDMKQTFIGGPFDDIMVGEWINTIDKSRLVFDSSGKVYNPDDNNTTVAYWWYEMPKDQFENRDDYGQGQILWIEINQIKSVRFENGTYETFTVSKEGTDMTHYKRKKSDQNITVDSSLNKHMENISK